MIDELWFYFDESMSAETYQRAVSQIEFLQGGITDKIEDANYVLVENLGFIPTIPEEFVKIN